MSPALIENSDQCSIHESHKLAAAEVSDEQIMEAARLADDETVGRA